MASWEFTNLTFSQIKKKTAAPRLVFQSKKGSFCGLLNSGCQGGRGPESQVVRTKRAANGRRIRGGKILMKKENRTEQSMNPCATPRRNHKK